MNKKRIIIYTIVGVISITFAVAVLSNYNAFTSGQSSETANSMDIPETGTYKIDESNKISTMQQWINDIETPEDSQVVPLINSAVHRAGQLWEEYQNIMNSGEVKIQPWEGIDIASGSWDSEDGKIKISLTFRTEEKRISECKKRIYSPEGTVEQFYRLSFYQDSETIRYSELDKNEFLWFHPGNKIKRYSRRLNPEEKSSQLWYSIEWDESGKIINELTQNFEIPEIQLPTQDEVQEVENRN